MRGVMSDRRIGRWKGCVLALALACGLPSAALAQQAPQPAEETRESLPLGEALEQFGRKAGFDIVFPETLVRGLRAGRVRPGAPPHEALDQMLKGTGLVARFTRPDAIILEPVQLAAAPDMTLDKLDVRAPALTAAQRAGNYQWYGQKLLEKSLVLLRSTTGLATRSYDLFVYLWVDADGRVTDVRAYGGDGERQEAELAASALTALAVKIPPPLDMPQPVGLRIASH